MPDIPEWQEEELGTVKRIVANENGFVRLPTKFDIHEWQILSDFSNAVESAKIARNCWMPSMARRLSQFQGGGSTARVWRMSGISSASEALRQIAIDWCEEHDIAWV